jgi:hypothetical protein
MRQQVKMVVQVAVAQELALAAVLVYLDKDMLPGQVVAELELLAVLAAEEELGL